MNSNQSYTGLIEKYVGTAYDKVKSVSENLTDITTVADISTDVTAVAGIASDVTQAVDDIAAFNNLYYGPLASEPSTKPNGDPTEEGDMYYNSSTDQMYVYTDNTWIPMGSVKNTVEVIKVTASHISGSTATITLSNSYIPNSNNLTVFVNSTYQYSIANGGGVGAYNEVNSNTIEFPDDAVAVGDEVTCIVGSIASTINPNISVTRKYYKTSAPSEQIIVIPDAVTYAPGAGNLEVYVDGLLQYVGTNYSETNSTTVTFNDPLTLGTEIIFKKGDIVSNIPTPDVDVETLNVATDFYVNNSSLQTDRVYYLKGYTVIGDGRDGFYYYNSAKARTAADGDLIIDSSVSLANQGLGTGNGCWMKQQTESVYTKYSPAGAGAVETTVETKLRQAVSVQDFGAVGDGATNDSAAVALAEAASDYIVFPEGTYLMGSSAWKPTAEKTYKFDNATLKFNVVSDAAIQLGMNTKFLGQLNIDCNNQTGSIGLRFGPESGGTIGPAYNCYIESLNVDGFKSVGVQFRSDASSGVYYNSINKLVIYNNDLDTSSAAQVDATARVGVGVQFITDSGIAKCNDNTIHDCIIMGYTTGVSIDNAAGVAFGHLNAENNITRNLAINAGTSIFVNSGRLENKGTISYEGNLYIADVANVSGVYINATITGFNDASLGNLFDINYASTRSIVIKNQQYNYQLGRTNAERVDIGPAGVAADDGGVVDYLRVSGGMYCHRLSSGSPYFYFNTPTAGAGFFFQSNSSNTARLNSSGVLLTYGGLDTTGDSKATGKGLFTAGLGVGNTSAATTPGSVTHKMPVYDASGTLVGYVPIYDGIA